MSPLIALYTELIYRPLLNGLVFIYASLPYADLGLAIFVLTFGVRVFLHPLVLKAARSQRAMARVQPELAKLQERFGKNREELGRRTMELYRAAGVHPLSGCLPILVQLPVLIGLYQVFLTGIRLEDPALRYSFIPAVSSFATRTFGLLDLTAPSFVVAIAAGLSRFLAAKFSSAVPPATGAAGDMQRALAWQMSYLLPIFIALISWRLPSALAFYWTILNALAIVENAWISRRLESEHERHSRTSEPHPGEDGHPRRG